MVITDNNNNIIFERLSTQISSKYWKIFNNMQLPINGIKYI